MHTMRKVVLALVLLIAAVAPAAGIERILMFISGVVVERNGDLDVTETIRVQAEGRDIRRGILRDFPTAYRRQDGTRVEVGFTVQSVMRDSEKETWTTEAMNNGVRVRIGSADHTLSFGPHTYVIRYRTTRQIGFFQDYDELYWNATGNGWTFAIDEAEARITLPAQVPFRQSAFYTGPQGGQGKFARVVEERPGTIVFRTTESLPRSFGLTVAAAWQKGVVDPPTSGQLMLYWLADNFAVPLAVVGLVLALGFYLYAWLKVGRDPPRGTIIPLFAPPPGMSAAAVRFVDNMGFDDRCFAVAIIDLGVNGHLRMDGSGTHPTIHRCTGGNEIPRAERAMEGKLFASHDSLTISQINHTPLGKARAELWAMLRSAYDNGLLFSNNFGWSTVGLIASIVLVLSLVIDVVWTQSPDRVGLQVFAILFPLPFVMGGASLALIGWQHELRVWWRVIVGLLVLATGLMAGLAAMWASARGPFDLVPALVAYGVAAVAGLAFILLKAPTVAGRKLMDQIDGFRQYLGTAEEDRLNALNPPQKTPELFERFLPYAIALDVQNAWGKRFAGVLAAAGAGAAAGAAASSWYTGERNWSDPASFADHIGSDLSRTISSASTPPGSSGNSGFGSSSGSSSSDSGGSSGGGSSGGGGGGGGGSGW